jgi:hypothetical protein
MTACHQCKLPQRLAAVLNGTSEKKKKKKKRKKHTHCILTTDERRLINSFF